MPTAILQGWVLSVLVVGLALTGCESLRVGSDYDRQASFAGYHRYSWLPREHPRTLNPLVVQRAHDSIDAALAAKGFVYVSDAAAADFMVDFTIGSRERTEVTGYPAPYTGPWYGGYGYYAYPGRYYGHPGGWWGYPYWGSDVSVYTYREGTLSIDVFDQHTHRPVWHGWAKKTLTKSDLERSEGPIREAVSAVLAQFPPP
jgi:hypothetical protein